MPVSVRSYFGGEEILEQHYAALRAQLNAHGQDSLSARGWIEFLMSAGFSPHSGLAGDVCLRNDRVVAALQMNDKVETLLSSVGGFATLYQANAVDLMISIMIARASSAIEAQMDNIAKLIVAPVIYLRF